MILSVPYERQHVMIPVNISCVCKNDYVHMLSYKALHDAFGNVLNGFRAFLFNSKID